MNFSLPSGLPAVEEPLKPERLRRIILDSPDWNKLTALLDFPSGTADKSPPANAGDVGSIPGPGRIPHASEQLKPVCHNYGACALEPTSYKY